MSANPGPQLPWSFSQPQPPTLYGPFKVLKYLLGQPIMTRKQSAGNKIAILNRSKPGPLLLAAGPIRIAGLGPSAFSGLPSYIAASFGPSALIRGGSVKLTGLGVSPLFMQGAPIRTSSPGPLASLGSAIVASRLPSTGILFGGGMFRIPTSPSPMVNFGGAIQGSIPPPSGTVMQGTGGKPIFTVQKFTPQPFNTPLGPVLTTRTLKYAQTPWGIANTAPSATRRAANRIRRR